MSAEAEDMMAAPVLYECSDGVGTITLNRPQRRNGMNAAMLRGVYELLRGLEDDRAARVIVLTGAGEWFCPGADIGPADNGETASRIPSDPVLLRVPAMLH